MMYLQATIFTLILITIILITIGSGAEARAMASEPRDCESHLLLSEVAHAYLGLFEFYCGKVSWTNCRSRINQVTGETRFINPFSGVRSDSLSIRLDHAIETLRDRFNEEQWRVVQAGLRALRERLRNESQDREQKYVETAPIFVPRETDRREMQMPIKSLSWHEAWGGLYLAGVQNGRLFLLPVVDGKLKSNLAHVHDDKPWPQVGSVSWIYADDRHYLISRGPIGNRNIYISEFLKSGELQEVAMPEKLHQATVRFATSPVKINGRDHIVATVNRDLVLLRPSSSGWSERTSIPVLEGGRINGKIHKLHTVKWRSQQYIVGIGESGIFIYKIENDSPIKMFESSDSHHSRDNFIQLTGGSIVLSGDHVLFATSELIKMRDVLTPQELYVFDLDLRVESIRSFRSPKARNNNETLKPSWVVKDGRTFLGLSLREPSTAWTPSSYSYFEWTGKELIDAGQFQSGGSDFLLQDINWFNLGPYLFSVFCSGSILHFLEHQDGQIVTSKSLPIPIGVPVTASAQYRGHGYVAVGNTKNTKLSIFDLTNGEHAAMEAR